MTPGDQDLVWRIREVSSSASRVPCVAEDFAYRRRARIRAKSSALTVPRTIPKWQ